MLRAPSPGALSSDTVDGEGGGIGMFLGYGELILWLGL